MPLFRSLLLLLLCSCTVTRAVRPVGAGNAALAASVGGPLFRNLGPPIPVPITEVYGRYGLTDTTDVDVGIQLPVVRAIGIDGGVTHLWLTQDGARPALSAGGRLSLLANSLALVHSTDPDTGSGYGLNPRLFEEIFATASWDVAQGWLVWTGADLFAQLEHARFRPSIVAGASWRVADHWDLALEGKWVAFTSNQSATAVDWVGIDGRGALALQFGATWYLGAL